MLLSSTGSLLPNPSVLNLPFGIPFDIKYSTTASALNLDILMFPSSEPTLSVCPSIFHLDIGYFFITPLNLSNKNGCPLDSDKDGIPDYTDICPGTPDGVEVDDLGCAYDLDADGIADYMDDCPDTPYDVDVDKTGCPMDSDSDGVPDYIDQCPGTLQGMRVDNTGCEIVREVPEPVVIEIVIPEIEFEEPDPLDEIILTSESSFEFNSTEIKPETFFLLDKLSGVMKKYPMSRWKIEGHTDNVGSEEGNIKISKLRADAVVEYFMSKGIPKGRLSTEGLGSSEPVEDNNTDEGRKKNRRVVIIRLN